MHARWFHRCTALVTVGAALTAVGGSVSNPERKPVSAMRGPDTPGPGLGWTERRPGLSVKGPNSNRSSVSAWCGIRVRIPI